MEATFPRVEGSANERAAVEYITGVAESLNLTCTETDFDSMPRGHSFSRTIEVIIPGEITDECVLPIPLNSYPGSPMDKDGTINLAIGLGIMRTWSKSTPPISIRLLFLGGEFGEEYGEDDLYPIGTKNFLRDYAPEFESIVLYLNFKTVPSRIQVRTGGRGIVTPYWLIDRCSTALKAVGLFHLILGNETQLFRLGLTDKETVIEPYLQAGYPSLSFEGQYSGQLPPAAPWVSDFLRFYANLLDRFSDGLEKTWDTHYLFFQVRYLSMIISERQFLIIIVAVLSGALLYPLVAVKRFRKYLHVIRRNVYTLPLLFLATFSFLLLGSLVVESICSIRNIPELWSMRPFLFFVMKTTTALTLLTASFNLIRRLPFSRSSSFYSASALLFFVIDIILFGVFDISLSYYFIWAFVWAFLFSLTPNGFGKSIFLLLSLALLVKVGYDIFGIPILRAGELLLLSRTPGNLLMSFILLPFMMMTIRLSLLFIHSEHSHRSVLRITALSIFALCTIGSIVYAMIFSPFDAETPQPISVTETIDYTIGERSLTIQSTAPLEELTIQGGPYDTTFYSAERSHITESDEIPQLIDIEYSATPFLDRKQILMELHPAYEPLKIFFFLTTEEDLVIFDSNFPFDYAQGDPSVRFYIGTHPPKPTQIAFTLPRETECVARIEIILESFPYDLTVNKEASKVDKIFKIIAEVPIGPL